MNHAKEHRLRKAVPCHRNVSKPSFDGRSEWFFQVCKARNVWRQAQSRRIMLQIWYFHLRAKMACPPKHVKCDNSSRTLGGDGDEQCDIFVFWFIKMIGFQLCRYHFSFIIVLYPTPSYFSDLVSTNGFSTNTHITQRGR